MAPHITHVEWMGAGHARTSTKYIDTGLSRASTSAATIYMYVSQQWRKSRGGRSLETRPPISVGGRVTCVDSGIQIAYVSFYVMFYVNF